MPGPKGHQGVQGPSGIPVSLLNDGPHLIYCIEVLPTYESSHSNLLFSRGKWDDPALLENLVLKEKL